MQLLAGTDAGTGVRGHVGVWGGILLFSPTVWVGFRGGEEGHTQEHTQERTRECFTYLLATYPLKSARKVFPKNIVRDFLEQCAY